MVDKNEREVRKRYDYPNVLAKIFNDLVSLQECAAKERKLFCDVLLEINNLSRADKLDKDAVEEITMKVVELINRTEQEEKQCTT